MAIHGHTWPTAYMPYMAIHGLQPTCHTWPYMAIHGHKWPTAYMPYMAARMTMDMSMPHLYAETYTHVYTRVHMHVHTPHGP